MVSAKINFLWKRLFISILIVYIFTYGLWIEFFGISNYYRYFVYSIVMIFALFAYVKFLFSKSSATRKLIFYYFVSELYFFVFYLIKHYGSIFLIYNYIFIPLSTTAFIFLFSNRGKLSFYAELLYYKVVIFGGIINAVISIMEFVTKTYVLSTASQHSISYSATTITRSTGLIGSSLINGIICGITVLTFLRLYYLNSKKTIYMILMFIAFFGLLSTFSRGPLISTIVSLLLFMIFKEQRSSKRTIKFFLFLILFVIFFSIVLNIQTVNAFLLRIQSIFNWTSDSGNSARIVIWTNLLKDLENNYLFGLGIGALKYNNILVTESGLLYVFYETGIVGLLIYFIPIIYILKYAIRKHKHNENQRTMYSLLIIVAILVENIILQVMTSLIVQLVFSVAASMILLGSTDSQSRIQKN